MNHIRPLCEIERCLREVRLSSRRAGSCVSVFRFGCNNNLRQPWKCISMKLCSLTFVFRLVARCGCCTSVKCRIFNLFSYLAADWEHIIHMSRQCHRYAAKLLLGVTELVTECVQLKDRWTEGEKHLLEQRSSVFEYWRWFLDSFPIYQQGPILQLF